MREFTLAEIDVLAKAAYGDMLGQILSRWGSALQFDPAWEAQPKRCREDWRAVVRRLLEKLESLPATTGEG